jgi:hypothetical protein
MVTSNDSVSVEIPAGSPASGVLVPLVLGLAARAGLPIERMDELSLAVELLVEQRARADLAIAATVIDGGMEIRIVGAATQRAADRQAIIAALVDSFEAGPDGIVLRVGA